MKNDKKILVAFLLNLFFSVFEFFGGLLTGSVAILSDALHDLGDSISIGASYTLEKTSQKRPDEKYTYGYIRYSLLGSFITTVVLLSGSIFVISNSIRRILEPTEINYTGMIIFAVIGFIVNTLAAILTNSEDSLNSKAVNLHMLEDSLGWAIVLIGAIVMRFTDFNLLDPIMSIALSTFIFINAIKNLITLLGIFLEKVPNGIDLNEIEHHLTEISGVESIHHLHIRSLDGYRHEATMHIVIDGDAGTVKKAVREELTKHGIVHACLETEITGEECHMHQCHIDSSHSHHHHHH